MGNMIVLSLVFTTAWAGWRLWQRRQRAEHAQAVMQKHDAQVTEQDWMHTERLFEEESADAFVQSLQEMPADDETIPHRRKMTRDDTVISEQICAALEEDKPHLNYAPESLDGFTHNILGTQEPVVQEDVLSFNIVAPAEGISGKALYLAMEPLNLHLGENHIFHRVEPIDKGYQVQFSLADMFEPGTFDVEQFFEKNYRGVVVFMTMAGPQSPLYAFEEMLSCARQLSTKLMAKICDAEQRPLTPQTLESMRERVRAYQRHKRNTQQKTAAHPQHETVEAVTD